MTTYIALVRGINLVGARRLSMSDLRAFGEANALRNVRTWINSGNMVFDDRRSPSRIESVLERSAEQALGFSAEFFVRSADEWDAIVEGNPLRTEMNADPGRLLLMLLKASVTPARVKALQAAVVGREQVRGAGRHVYTTYPDGIGVSKLKAAVIDKALGTRSTARNWNTVLKLAAMAHE